MYLDVLGLLNFGVDLLLLLATNRLSGYPTEMKKCLLAAALGGIYGCVCVLPEWRFLGHSVWRVACLWAMGLLAFGARGDAMRRCAIFILLSMALGGLASGIGRGNFVSLLLAAVVVCLMCLFGLRGRLGRRFLPVTVRHQGECFRFYALLDTGNILTDPISGQQVLIVSSYVGKQLLNLTEEDLKDAVGALRKISGGRLIPFHSVGVNEGLLAAKRFQDVTIGSWHGGCLLAFAPQALGTGYDALTGGM